MAKPTVYRREVADKIIEMISNGKSLTEAFRELGLPRTTVNRWIENDRDSFGERVKEAIFWRTEAWADQVIDLSDAAPGGDMAMVTARRLQVDSRKWMLAKLRPAEFGDKVQVEHSGRTFMLHAGHPDGFENSAAVVIEGRGTQIVLPDNRRTEPVLEAVDGQALEIEDGGSEDS